VLHADSETIGASQTTTIGGPQTITVGAERTVTVGASETISVTKERHETVGATEDVTIAKGRAHTVQEGGDALHLPKGDRTITLDDGNHVTSVAHTTSLETDDATTHARKTINVTGDDKIVVTQGQTTATMEAGNVDLVAAGRVRLTHKGTSILVDDAGKVTVTAEPELEVNCQGAQIKMGAGKIAMNAPTEITLAVGQSGVKISGTGVEMSGPNMKSTALEGINEISGLAVKLN
jgi:type VI secretion system secreted protein VgrG